MLSRTAHIGQQANRPNIIPERLMTQVVASSNMCHVRNACTESIGGGRGGGGGGGTRPLPHFSAWGTA